MNAGAPTCSTCGGLNTSPQANQCRFCGRPLAVAPAPQPYAAQPGGYGAPPPYAGYGAPPGGYGAPGPYGAPNPYGQQQGYPVQGFGGGQPYPVVPVRSGWNGWSTFFIVRVAIAAIAIGISLLGACISALSH